MKSNLVLALEHAGWPALLVDGGGRILHANESAVKLFGPALEGGQPLLGAIWSAENDASADQFLAHWERSPSPGLYLKYRIKGGGMSTCYTAVCAHSDGAEKNFVLQLLADFEVQRTSSDLSVAQKQKLECALQLAQTVALDFNNTLTTVLGYTSMLLSKAEPDHPWRRPLLEVEKAAVKASGIANDLASFSRKDKEVHQHHAGNLNEILQRCAETFQKSDKNRLTWEMKLERGLFVTKFDESKIQQAFMKIVANAVEAINGEGCIVIHTRNVQLAQPTQDRNAKLAAGSYVCVEVSDNGAGIDPAVMPRIFEPFFTTKEGPHQGLGLAWVYGIVTNHDGRVAVSSAPGAGTSVRVYLPAQDVIVRDEAQSVHDLSGNQTILVVDDEELLLTMVETVLSSFGYKVLTANTVQKALEIVEAGETAIDLIIADVVMPAMSGRELVEQIRRISPGIRVILSSGYHWPSKLQDADVFLQKPFTAQDLLSKVKHLLASPFAQVD